MAFNWRYLSATALIFSLAYPAFTQTAKPADKKAAAKPAAQKKAPKAALPEIDQPDDAGLYNVSLLELGATGTAGGVAVNKDWPANNALQRGSGRGGVLMGAPLKGGRVDIHLIVPVDIKELEVVPLDYNGTVQPKSVDIFVDGKLVTHFDLPETPGKPIRIPLEAKGQDVGILITDEYPIRTLANGKKGPNYGGWSRLRVMTTENVAEMLKPVEQYAVKLVPASIAPTAGSSVGGEVKVYGEPRQTKGHPNTLWDNEDIAQYKEMLKTSKELQAQYAGLKKAADLRVTKPLGIPQPKKDADGKWMHLSDKAPYEGKTYGAVHNQLALDIANMATVYALSGESKYGDFCKQLLLAYADAHPNYGIGARQGFSHDPSKVFDQRLSDATWLIPIARGYDLIYNLPTMTPDERKHIEDDLVKANARHIMANRHTLGAMTNWSAIDTCAILIAGYATDDQELISTAMYGFGGTKDKPTGGLFLKHFGEGAIDVDGMWNEGAMGYQFMALEALVMDAEILWHHGIDMYRHRGGVLKQLFDSPIQICYPDLTTPAIHDSHHGTIIGHDSFLYEYAYRRYRDPSYLLILDQIGRHLNTNFQEFPVSFMYDRPAGEKTPPVEWKSVNFFGVGYGILRQTTSKSTNSILLDYGPNRSHGHPDKLNIDLYAFNDQLMPDPGIVWYEQPLYKQWYHTTLAHNTLTVDEQSQVMAGAEQTVYAPADTISMQRAWTRDAYPGVTMDRALFMTHYYVADIFGAFSRLPRKMDLAWHIRGEFSSSLPFTEYKIPEPKNPGYMVLNNVRRTTTSNAWRADITRAGNVARFMAAGGTPTDIIVGDGYYGRENPPAIIQRRNASSTVYANVIDIAGAKDGYVKNITQQGGLDAGYAALLIDTAEGTDICLSAYRPGTYKAGDLETNGQQAMVHKKGGAVQSMYLASGTILRAADAQLERNEPGLAYVESAENGGYIVGNPSPADATIKLNIPSAANMDAYNIDTQGKRLNAGQVQRSGSQLQLTLKAGARLELSPSGAASLYDTGRAKLQKIQDEQTARAAELRQAAIARTKVREADAKAHPVPGNTIIVINAADFSDQGDGKVSIGNNKTAAIGNVIAGWNSLGHWLEWSFDAPADGYYNLSLCYCSQNDKIEREISVNGAIQEPYAPMIFDGTGGWANGSDDWRLATAGNPVADHPLLIQLRKGKNIIRMTNSNDRGLNVNYIAITSPDVIPTRELLTNKLPQ